MSDLDDIFRQIQKGSKQKRHHKDRNLFAVGVLLLVSVLLTLPLFIVVYRYVPDIQVDIGQLYRVDHILSFLILLFTIRLLLNVFRNIVLGLLLATVIALGINQLRGEYGFSHIYQDYHDMLAYVQRTPVKLPFLKDAKMTVRNAPEIKEAVDYQDPKVRRFAVEASQAYFNEPDLYNKYGRVVRYFSIFKVLNDWTYIHDPQNENYYAKASESVELMAGDCDDYAILMAACIKAIGGEPRVIHTDRHLYPEVKVCHEDEFEEIIYLIKRVLFYKETLGDNIYYHVDEQGYIWLNFDYTGNYPGAPFMSDNVIGILEL
ncbi:MAG: transglutaminase family protein [Bacteroidales bacterium]